MSQGAQLTAAGWRAARGGGARTTGCDGLPALTELDLSYSNITDQALLALRNLRTLTSLNLEGCENVTAAGMQAPRNTTAAPSLHIEFIKVARCGPSKLV